MRSIIQIDSLYKEYDDVVAVDGVDLDLPSGEFFTLLGPSGSGKTTILRLIAGLEYPTRGSIVLDDVDVTDTAAYNRNVATVFQDYALFPKMTVRENIGYGLKIRGRDDGEIEERVSDLLDLINLPEVGDRLPAQLSGGQQQRVALARSLAIEPDVLLLDEPLGALDEKLRQDMQIELKELQEHLGMTFVYVTHDQEEAMTMSDQIAVINDGEIVQLGDPDEVYEKPRTEFIASFFRGSNIFEGEIIRHDDEVVTLSFGDYKIAAHQPVDFSVDDFSKAKFFIRSNNIQFGDGFTNTIEGEITSVIYRGQTVEHIVETDAAQIGVTTMGDNHQEGDTVTLGWSPEDTIILEK